MSLPAVLASIPSPSSGQIDIGPIPLRAYGVCIALGVYAAVAVAGRRYRARGGDPEAIVTIALWAVPAGIVGARLYHVITDYELYTGRWTDAFKIWDGGLGIWGGVLAGVFAGVVVARRRGLDARVLLDCVAPALPLAQAIGRWGNYFNQELFGRPTTLPWGLRIDLAHRPAAYANATTFHPTFLYECLWDLAVVGIVVLAERRLGSRLRQGYLFAVYVAAYTFGRFWVESLRIDNAHRFFGLRLNDWTSIVVFAAGAAFVVRGLRGEGPRVADETSPVDAAPGAGADEPAAGAADAAVTTTAVDAAPDERHEE